MDSLDGRVAIVTGAGRGLGREHALLLAAQGARVVVNDLGGAMDGQGNDQSPAQQVVDEILNLGGEAVANADDVADDEGAARLVSCALDTFGQLDVLINNAGILRDRMFVNMTVDDWDSIMRVHLRGHFSPTRHAVAHWRARIKAGETVHAAIVNTVSPSGLLVNPGQANYGTAKAGLAAFTQILAVELSRYGIRVNAIAPAARTRLTEATPGLGDTIGAPEAADAFDLWNPANISPLVIALASPACTISGRVFFVQGGKVQLLEPWSLGAEIDSGKRWDVNDLGTALEDLIRRNPHDLDMNAALQT